MYGSHFSVPLMQLTAPRLSACLSQVLTSNLMAFGGVFTGPPSHFLASPSSGPIGEMCSEPPGVTHAFPCSRVRRGVTCDVHSIAALVRPCEAYQTGGGGEGHPEPAQRVRPHSLWQTSGCPSSSEQVKVARSLNGPDGRNARRVPSAHWFSTEGLPWMLRASPYVVGCFQLER